MKSEENETGTRPKQLIEGVPNFWGLFLSFVFYFCFFCVLSVIYVSDM